MGCYHSMRGTVSNFPHGIDMALIGGWRFRCSAMQSTVRGGVAKSFLTKHRKESRNHISFQKHTCQL